MKIRTALAAASVCLLAACQTTTGPATSSSSVDSLVGKRLVADNGTIFLFNPDGTVGGVFQGDTIVGTYRADATEVCSTYSQPERLSGREFCSVPDITGDMVVFNRRDGSQSAIYTIEG